MPRRDSRGMTLTGNDMGGRAVISEIRHSLAGEWALVVSDAGAYATPADIPDKARQIPAPVPGTVAEALENAGRFDRAHPVSLNDRDFWYLAALDSQPPGPARLLLDGLATIAEVYVNGRLVLESVSQFIAHDVSVVLKGHGQDQIAICFRALNPRLKSSGPRARWRPQMITPPGMRLIRATALGHMPGWCPDVEAVGPFRPIHLVRSAENEIDALRLSAGLDDAGVGVLDVSFRFAARAVDLRIACGGVSTPVMISAEGLLTARLEIPAVKPWMPHTHGEPNLYGVDLLINGAAHQIGRVGFRNIALDQGADGKGFGVEINGVPVFCRGAVWTNADIVRLPGARDDYLPWLQKARDAGMNMIRIGGTMTYETPEFFALCDELGLMVWQDFMFANFDYPAADPAFADLVRKEAVDLLSSIQGSPSLTVLCGGSEMFQQAAMLGMPERFWSGPITDEILPSVYEELRPDVIYAPNSPFGGAMPFSPNEGVTHYYGVGAYCRPLEDARRAEVRFSAESLAFAHVPEAETLEEHLPVMPVHDPRWKARVPRDRGASWDFEDIRDHYLQLLYSLDPMRLRREDVGRYLTLSRATTVEVVEAAYAEWRRPGSPTSGALVWTLQDLLPGPGWGVIDATGLEKPVWHGLRRAFRPLTVVLSDEGTSGLYAHVINETSAPRTLTLTLTCLRDGQTPVVGGKIDLDLPPRGTASFAATDLFGAFFDATYAFRFGPPAHDVTIAQLLDRMTGEEIASAFHFPHGRNAALHRSTVAARLAREADEWALYLSADRLAQSVHFDLVGWRASDNWLHLAPGQEKRLTLAPRGETPSGLPSGAIRHLQGGEIRF